MVPVPGSIPTVFLNASSHWVNGSGELLGIGEDGPRSSVIDVLKRLLNFLQKIFAARSHELDTKSLGPCAFDKAIGAQNVGDNASAQTVSERLA